MFDLWSKGLHSKPLIFKSWLNSWDWLRHWGDNFFTTAFGFQTKKNIDLEPLRLLERNLDDGWGSYEIDNLRAAEKQKVVCRNNNRQRRRILWRACTWVRQAKSCHNNLYRPVCLCSHFKIGLHPHYPEASSQGICWKVAFLGRHCISETLGAVPYNEAGSVFSTQIIPKRLNCL